MKRLRVLILLNIFVQFSLLALPPVKGFAHYIDPRTTKGLQQIFHYDGKSLPFLSSHRGGQEDNMPENCIATFANTLNYTYSIMEIDPRYTKDSVMVVLHDPTLQRTTTGSGKVIDYTFEELKKFRLKDKQGNATEYCIPTFGEVLKWGRGKTIFVLDNKGVPIDARVNMVKKKQG